MGNVCAVGSGAGAGKRRAWDSAGNACAAYAGEWGASLAAGTPELAPMRRVDTLPPCLDFRAMR